MSWILDGLKFNVSLEPALLDKSVYEEIETSFKALVSSMSNETNFKVIKDKEEKVFNNPFELFQELINLGKKGVSIQRYKGLGEMNPDQLWETTLNSSNRILLKVTIDDAAEADSIFSVLMGDEVAPRRKFIEDNALEIEELDI